jgi:Flp pilus assembly protein TadD
MAHLKDAIQRDPNDSMLLFKLGVYAAEIGDPEGARAWFGAAAKEGAPESIREELRRRLGRFGS